MGERGSERERAGVRKRDLEMEGVIKPTEERDEKERRDRGISGLTSQQPGPQS